MKKVIFSCFFILLLNGLMAQKGMPPITREYIGTLPSLPKLYSCLNKLYPGIGAPVTTETRQFDEQSCTDLVLIDFDDTETDLITGRRKVAQFGVVIGNCAYTVDVYIHSFLGITWGSYYYGEPVLVGCV